MVEWFGIIMVFLVFGFLIKILGRAIMNIGISIGIIILVIVILNGLMVMEW